MKHKIRKPVWAFLLLFLLIGLLVGGIVISSVFSMMKRIELRNDLKKEGVIQTLKVLEAEVGKAYDSTMKKTESTAELMAVALRSFIDGNDYNGPMVFEDGVVIRRVGDKIKYPEEFGKEFLFTRDSFDETDLTLIPDFTVDGAGNEEVAYLTTKHIAGDWYYYDLTMEEELKQNESDINKIIGKIAELEKSYDGYLLLIDADDPNLGLFYVSEDWGNPESAINIGFTQETLNEQIPLVVHENGAAFSCTYTQLKLFDQKYIAVLMVNSTSEMYYIFNCVIVVVLMILIMMSAVILWEYWLQKYVWDNGVTDEQKRNYHPGRIRRLAFSLGIAGMILIFLVTITWQSLSNLYKEVSSNRASLEIMSERIKRSEDLNSLYRDDEESWAVYYAERIAQLAALNPELVTHDFLAEANRIIGSEYIMIFDDQGKELSSSNSFVNLVLEEDVGPEESDFTRLTNGAETIVHAPAEDIFAGKNTQQIGTRVPLADGSSYGVLLLAIDPLKSWQADEQASMSTFMSMIAHSGNLSFLVDKNTGIVLYSSDGDLVGARNSDIGIAEENLDESDFDSFVINNLTYYGPFISDESYRYYYLTESAYLQSNTLPFALVSAIGFLIIDVLINAFMLAPYKAKDFNESVVTVKSGREDYYLDDSVNYEWQRIQETEEDRPSIRELWKKLVPERKVSLYLQILLSILLVWLLIMIADPDSGAARSALGFVLRGNWKRGVNLMAFAGLVLLIIGFVIFLFIKNLLMTLLKSVLDRKAETIVQLMMSLVQYAAIIALLFISFNYFGFDTRTLLASVSFLSLAVTLGARDLVADILAGIFIIFEDDFHVGDIIEVNGFSGIVQEIGVRSTKLIGIGDNIKIIGNQSVKNILNMSKMNSWYSIDLNVPADQPLLEIEEMLNEELPKIGQSIPEVLSGPFYKGVMSIGANNTLYIIAECRQTDYRKVQRKLNHAIRTLFDERGYKIG